MMATQPVLIIGSMGTTNHGETKECTINKVPPYGIYRANCQMKVRMSFLTLNELTAFGGVWQYTFDGFTYMSVEVGPLPLRVRKNSLKHS